MRSKSLRKMKDGGVVLVVGISSIFVIEFDREPRSQIRENSTGGEIPQDKLLGGLGSELGIFIKSQSLSKVGSEFFRVPGTRRKLGRGIFPSPKAHLKGDNSEFF